jgi:hypothetical protein
MMRILWNILKVFLALALGIPLAIIVLATGLGILGAMLGIAVLALKLVVVAVIGWGAFRLIAHLVGGPAKRAQPYELVTPPPVDVHYEAAMRELNQELGHSR